MIYLVDEKKARQVEFGIDTKILDTLESSLITVRNLRELKSFSGEFDKPENWFLFHDSFLSNLGHNTEDKQRLIDKSNEGSINLVLFGGSGEFNLRRKLGSTSFKLPVEVLYRNLIHFVESAKLSKPNIDDLFYGKDKEYFELAEIRFQAISHIYQREGQTPNHIPYIQAKNWNWFTSLILASQKEIEERDYSLKELKQLANSLIKQ